MSLWEEIQGQDEACSFLKKQFEGGKFSQAYLFSGPEGIGKRQVAKILAATLNCESQGCGICHSCSKILRKVHPDVLFIEPEGNYLSIEKIREIKNQAFLKPVESKVKICILDETEKLTAAAANALLKILEEPPFYFVFILLSSNSVSLPPTIISRCQLVRFKPLSRKFIADYLRANQGLTSEKARLIAALSRGNLRRALKLEASSKSLKKRESVLNTLLDLDRLDLLNLLEKVAFLVEENKKEVTAVKAEQKKEEEEFFSAGLLSKAGEKELKEKHQREVKRKEEESFLEILLFVETWYRDLLILKESPSDLVFREELPLVNIDKLEALKKFLPKFTLNELIQALYIVRKTRKYLRAKVNRVLSLEGMFLELGSLNA